jgi:membrane-associated phospholipid phosphatase
LNSVTEPQVQQELVEITDTSELSRQRALRRVTIALGLIISLSLFFLWLPVWSRRFLFSILVENRLLVGSLLLFALVALSLLWSVGQRLDVWLFRTLNLGGYHALWMDRLMWLSTQIGNFGFATAVIIISYILGDHHFALGLTLGTLTLFLWVTIFKALTDRARPFLLLSETRVIGWRAAGLSFPSGHTAQTFFLMTLAVGRYQLPLGVVLVLYSIALLVGFTRVYLGVHYPRDVVAGAILGTIWGTLGVMVVPYLFG